MWTQVTDALIQPDQTSFVVVGLQTGLRYKFRVAAVNRAGRSPFAEISEPVTCASVVGRFSLSKNILKLSLSLLLFILIEKLFSMNNFRLKK